MTSPLGPKILIVGVNWLGDVLFLTPAIRALKAHFPEACFACAVPARCAGLLQNNPYLSEVIEWDDKIFLWTPFKFFSTLRRIKKRRFNSVIFFHRSKTKAFMAWLAGIRRRAGYEAPFQDLHRTDHFLNLIKKMGVPPAGRTPDFFIKKGTEEELRGLLLEKGVALGEPYIVVHAGGNWEKTLAGRLFCGMDPAFLGTLFHESGSLRHRFRTEDRRTDHFSFQKRAGCIALRRNIARRTRGTS